MNEANLDSVVGMRAMVVDMYGMRLTTVTSMDRHDGWERPCVARFEWGAPDRKWKSSTIMALHDTECEAFATGRMVAHVGMAAWLVDAIHVL